MIDFEVTINGESRVFELYHDALNFIETTMAQWNNFNDGIIFTVTIRKVPSSTFTHRVHVADQNKMEDIFGVP